ncbi:paraquat-inducible protein A [Azospirillum rugosum]|uniref:Paraquat-inducible protein A n=1 Tax=Azospirillum rugosum TaxID=416170 RepID=A0ABS4SW37_9PROT|nr:paraquat-inducible protein A [Azospirillum rugosum]MBP2296776.1 paraquat-inducible protein A [Azospirillum rugosum]MDQ0530379.1 paraquat-inducible protein A [Azospirillum rugosum]
MRNQPHPAERLRECPGCGLFQTVPALAPGMTAQCPRCSTSLERATRHPIGHSVALNLTALVLLVIMCSTTLMTVQKAGISLSARLFSGPAELVRRDMAELAVAVLFVTVVAPLFKLLGTLYVLLRLREAAPPRHLCRVFALVERLGPWSMIEVFVFGVFVAYVKLGDLVKITLDVGVYALLALTVVLIWADSALDREAVWDRLDRRGDARGRCAPPDRQAVEIAAVEIAGCEVCGLVSGVDGPMEAGARHRCPRCGSALHPRKPDSVARTWALVIAAAALYIPANYFPVLTVMQLGAGAPSTILGGVEELVASRMYPLAALVFFASVAVPMLKLVGLSVMLVSTQTGRTGWLRDRTRLYHVVRWIGRWSMIDIFMEALLGALVKFGSVVTIEPGIGAVAFCGVVILTMFAAETFDPRLMWDAAGRHAAAPAAA